MLASAATSLRSSRRPATRYRTFDFALPGVTSISADLHKFGFCPKPASTVFYRSPTQAACQPFEVDDWPGGRFATATLAGTRPGGAIAGAWATLHAMGERGYVDTARQIMAARSGVSRWHRGDRPRSPGRARAVDPLPSRRARSTCWTSAKRWRAGWLPGVVRAAARHASDAVDAARTGARGLPARSCAPR